MHTLCGCGDVSICTSGDTWTSDPGTYMELNGNTLQFSWVFTCGATSSSDQLADSLSWSTCEGTEGMYSILTQPKTEPSRRFLKCLPWWHQAHGSSPQSEPKERFFDAKHPWRLLAKALHCFLHNLAPHQHLLLHGLHVSKIWTKLHESRASPVSPARPDQKVFFWGVLCFTSIFGLN